MREQIIELKVGFGTEWVIDTSKATSIVKSMIPFFQKNDYYGGLKEGIERTKSCLKNVSWTLCDENSGCIEKITIKKVLEVNKTNIKLLTIQNKELNMRYSIFMLAVIREILKKPEGQEVYCRILDLKDQVDFVGKEN